MSGILTRMIGAVESRGVMFTDELWRSVVNARSSSGVQVTPVTAMQSATVYGCVRLLSESAATLPLDIFRNRRDKGKDLVTNHPLCRVLQKAANEEMSAFTLREMLMSHVLLWGNAYAEIVYNDAGDITALWPLAPNVTFPLRGLNQELIYSTQLPERFGYEHVTLPADKVLHIRGLGSNGIVGWSPIRLMREAIGLALATEKFGAAFFGNGASPGLMLKHPGKLSQSAYDRIKASWEDRHQGLDNASRIAILEEGITVEKIGIPPDDAQFLQSRQFQVVEICRIYRVPPHMVADLSHATFSNIEQQSIDFVTYSLSPWLVRQEQEYSRSLLTEPEQNVLELKHNTDGMKSGDITSRFNAYHQARQDGWLSANDIRTRENMNPVEGGDMYLVPLNMVPATSLLNPPASPEKFPPAAPPARSLPTEERKQVETRSRKYAAARFRMMNSYKRVFRDTATRMMRREARDIQDAAKKYLRTRSVGQFDAWVEDYYTQHSDYISRQMLPVLQAYGETIGDNAAEETNAQAWQDSVTAFIAAYMGGYLSRHTSNSKDDIAAALRKAMANGEDPEDAVNQEVQGWEDTRPDQIAREEGVRCGNAVTKLVYRIAHILRISWMTMGNSCDYCKALDGTTVGIEEDFMTEGDNYQPEGTDRPMHISRDLGHPPAHDGCECGIGAAS